MKITDRIYEKESFVPDLQCNGLTVNQYIFQIIKYFDEIIL